MAVYKVKPVKIDPKLVPIRAGPPVNEEQYSQTVELTGKGNLLVYDGFGGRLFRSSYKAVKEAVEFFIEDYEKGNWLNWNDLYALFGIEQTHFGAIFGYSPSEDYKCDLMFDITLVKAEEIKDSVNAITLEKYHEDVLVVEPDPRCLPMESYMEV